MSELDVRDLEPPRYTVGDHNSRGKVSLKIREFPGAAPVTIQVDENWTVDHAERKFARAKEKNPQSVRFTVNGQPLPKDTKIANLSPQVLSGLQIIDAAPEHSLGRLEHAGLPDFDRLLLELSDLPYKHGYGELFKVTARSLNQQDLLRPYLWVKAGGRWFKYHLNLSQYPTSFSGQFVGALPPCPIHGGKHPHVWDNGTICWGLERSWSPSMTLAEDLIPFLFRTLSSPTHHLGCRLQ